MMEFKYSLAGGIVAVSLLLAGCGQSKSADAAPGPAKPARDPMTITPAKELLSQLQLGAVRQAPVAATLRVAAWLEADATRISHVNTQVTGRITELEVVEGQSVAKGSLIAHVRSTELSGAQSEFLKARSQQTLQERAVERAKRLLEAGVIGEAELQRREAELAQTQTEVSSSRDQLRVLGMSEEALKKLETSKILNSLFEIHANIDGIVLERKVTVGQVVQAADPVCILADLSRVWLVADLPEQAAGTVAVGKSVEAEIPSLPDVKIRGHISWVSSTVNPETRTVRVRMDLPNPNRRFKPAMLANMLLKDAAQVKPVVPAAAVVREGDETFVFVETQKGTFQLRPVQLGEEFDGQVVLVDGITEKDKVVTAGAFHLNNERKRLAIQGS